MYYIYSQIYLEDKGTFEKLRSSCGFYNEMTYLLTSSLSVNIVVTTDELYMIIRTLFTLFLSLVALFVVWINIHFSFNIPPPTNIRNLFGNWLNEIEKQRLKEVL